MIYPASKAYQVAIPFLSQNPFNFAFASDLPQGRFSFVFKWFKGVWNIWVTLPTGEIRQAGGYPNTVSWTGFKDYYFRLITTLDSIGQNDLNNVKMVVYQV